MKLIADGGKDKPTLDDLVKRDDLDEFKKDVLDAVEATASNDDHDHDEPDEPWPFEFGPEDLDQVVEAKTQGMLDHIADPEACDSAACESLRDKYGFTVDDEAGSTDADEYADDEETEEEETDADDESDDDEDEPETGMFGARL